MSSPGTESETNRLLRLMGSGDREALNALVVLHEPFVRGYVRKQMSKPTNEHLRQFLESGDLVQVVCTKILEKGFGISIEDEGHFRRLLARMVRNEIVDRHRARGSSRRVENRTSLHTKTKLDGQSPMHDRATASRGARLEEASAEVRLARQLLDPDDNEVLTLREEDGLTFEKIGERIGLSTEGARKRFDRAVGRFGLLVVRLRARNIKSAVDLTASWDGDPEE